MSERGPEQDPRNDPEWETHQQRNLVSGDFVLFQTEKYGTRARIYFGEPLNAQEIRWQWRVDLSQEEMAAVGIDVSFTSMLLARKSSGAYVAVANRAGALAAKVDELQGFIAAAGERAVALNGTGDAGGEAESGIEPAPPSGGEGGAESAL